jgi:hypothetical protein
VPSPTMMSPALVDDVGLPDGRPLIWRHRVQALHHGCLARARIRKPRRQAGDLDTATDRAV